MDRRTFVMSVVALALIGCTPSASKAAPFAPSRFSVEVQGSGPDVILIPGLTAGRDVWRATADGVPGYRYHLVQVAGFAGDPPRGNAQGAVVIPLADEIARYIADRRLDRPALVGHSMGGTLALLVASRRPDLVGRVMVVDMLPEPAGLVGGSAADFGPLADNLRGMLNSESGKALFSSIMGAFSPPDSANRRSDPDVVARSMHELARIDLRDDLAAGLIVALAAIYVIEVIGHAVYPLPAEANLRNFEGVGELLRSMPLGAQAFVALAWLAGAFVGGLTAARISRSDWPGWAIAALVALASILNVVMIPHPEWMQIAAVVAPAIGGLLAVRLARRARRVPFAADA